MDSSTEKNQRKPVASRRRGEELSFDEKFAQKTRKFGISNMADSVDVMDFVDFVNFVDFADIVKELKPNHCGRLAARLR